MEFTTERVLERKLKAVEDAIYEDVLELPVWQTRQGYYAAPGEYTDCGEWESISLGERWVCSDGTTRWFKTTVEIPEKFAGKYVVLELDFGGEALVKINGVIKSALTSYLEKNEAQRTRVVLPGIPSAGERLEIEAEAGLNYMEFAAFRRQGITSIEYQFRMAKMAVVDPVAEKYYFDIKTAFDAVMALKSPIDKLAAANVRIPFETTRVLESFTKDSYMYKKILDA